MGQCLIISGGFKRPALPHGGSETFYDGLRRFDFDTVLYTAQALELLFKTVGPDRCLFGTERPGVGTASYP